MGCQQCYWHERYASYVHGLSYSWDQQATVQFFSFLWKQRKL